MASMTETKWYSDAGQGRITCDLCPRACTMKEGDRGFCFVRKNVDGRMVLDTYGKSTGFCIDPIEKKPLNHFLPGTPVLSFGTAGCNLGCKFCQNWDISKSREVARLSDHAMPMEIALAAQRSGCRSVAFTYNDPVIWAEYAIDTAKACHELGLKSVAVTAGYLNPESRRDFFSEMDAANIDLKAFEEDFYYKLTSSHLQPILDTIEYACNETDCWVELTNLIIPDANDSESEIRRMCDWILDRIGSNVPVHFTAFHPDFRMTDRPRTSHEKLIMAYDVAKMSGLNYVYVGNVHDVDRQSTSCHGCGELLIQRDWHQLGHYSLSNNKCSHCGVVIPGVFEDQPGAWGAKRQPIRIQTQRVPNEGLVQLGASSMQTKVKTKMETADITKLSQTDQQTIHRAACAMVRGAVEGSDPGSDVPMLGELSELLIHGVFVTAKRGATLRGCCGRQGQVMKLGDAMADSAGRTTRDPRMAPLSRSELPFLDLSISLLGPMRPIGVSGDKREQAVKIGTHGLRIQAGQNAGLLLPQVAIEQGWNERQFLDAVCRKANLPAGTWRGDDVDLMLFDGICFGEGFHTDSPQETFTRPLVPSNELEPCRRWVHSNLIAMQAGATPMYYAMGVSDQEVLGLVLSVEYAGQDGPGQDGPGRIGQQWLHLSVRETRPMQSSLYQMTQQAAQWLGTQCSAADCQVDVAILSDCVHRGAAVTADLRGMLSSDHAVVLTDGRRWAVQFERDGDPESTAIKAKQLESFRGAEQLYSMQCDSTADVVSVSLGPRSDASVTTRQPAVAGTFYPAEDASRESELDRMMAELPEFDTVNAFAIMVPHAGLRFSGRVAGDVWRRMRPPKRMLIIGPKHTAEGADWAVAPHDRWMMNPNAAIAGDMEMANQLADRLPQVELDSGAHAREHGIEIQLPFLYRLFPQTRIAGLVMSGGTEEQLRPVAKGLANWIKEQEEPPLLVISSDMNHFADDEENRRRDRMAIDATLAGDGGVLLKVCAEENISMCGQVPAALVLMVMKELGMKTTATEIAYATSADFGGDPKRVVGYSGVIWEEG